jgi:hypothetical protein
MKRFAALSTIVVGVVVSSCAVGVRGPATDITKTSATLNGKVLSTTGGPGSWYIEYGPTTARTEKTPTRTIDFVANELKPVSEPVSGLELGTKYHFAVCAEDSENAGDAFCSRDQTFTTDFDPSLTLTRDCSRYPPSHGLHPSAAGLPPNTVVHGRLDFPDGTSVEGGVQTGSDGSADIGSFFNSVAGTWTVTVGWSGGTLVDSLFVDCAEPPPSK